MTDSRFGRRIALKAMMAGAAGSLASNVLPNTAQAGSKATKAQAGYQAKPGPGGAHCSGCANYIPTGSKCMQVQGTVAPGGYCNFYAPKG